MLVQDLEDLVRLVGGKEVAAREHGSTAGIPQLNMRAGPVASFAGMQLPFYRPGKFPSRCPAPRVPWKYLATLKGDTLWGIDSRWFSAGK
jgi:hypothetical protein